MVQAKAYALKHTVETSDVVDVEIDQVGHSVVVDLQHVALEEVHPRSLLDSLGDLGSYLALLCLQTALVLEDIRHGEGIGWTSCQVSHVYVGQVGRLDLRRVVINLVL